METTRGLRVADRVSEIISGWKQAVAAGTLPSLVVLYGESDIIVRKAVEILVSAVFAKGGRDLNHQVFEARSSKPAQWLVAARTAPMMAPRRVVQVTEADALFTSEGKLSDEDAAALLEFCKSARKGMIVLTARSVDKRSKLATALKNAGALHAFDPFEDPEEIREFIRGVFRSRGLTIEGAAAAWLAEVLGKSCEAILAESDKLLEYAGDSKVVTLSDAQEMVQRLQGHDLYELNRALVQRDAVLAVTILDRMFSNLVSLKKKVPQAALPLLVLSTCIEGELRKMAIAKGFESSMDRAGLAARLKVKENIAGIILANSRRFSTEELERGLSSVREVDKRLKSTSLPPRLLLEELILSICLRAPSPPADSSKSRSAGSRSSPRRW